MEGGLSGAYYTNGKGGGSVVLHECNLKSPGSNGQDPDGIRSGACNFYGSFLSCFSVVSGPFNAMVKNDAEIDWEALQKIK